MPTGSRSFPPEAPASSGALGKGRSESSNPGSVTVLWLQVLSGYGLIEAAIWTPDGPMKAVWMTLATVFVLLATIWSRFSISQLGLGKPKPGGTWRMLGGGLLLASAVPLLAVVLGRWPHLALPWLTVDRALQYAVWALQQQFLLQSFFYIRLESALGSRCAVIATALLFAAAHIPSPVLTVFSLAGGLFFCEMFRRYRSIYPLGLVHAALGLIIARSFPDQVLHHMRVGWGYLHFH